MSSTSTSHATVIPFAPTIGAEIKGIQVQDGLTKTDYTLVRKVLDQHGVVVLRDQEVSPANHRSFTAGIGTLRPLTYSRYSLPEYPEVMIVSNIKKDGQNIGISDAGQLWHSDGAYNSDPDLYSLLYGIDIPQRNGKALGDTLFASVIKAYEALDETLRKRLAGLRCINSLSFHVEKKARLGQLRRALLTPEQKAATPDVEHPVVCRHPHTGLPYLFVNEATTKAIVGLSEQESDALLAQLWAHIVSPQFIYRHSWRKGDLVIWDNFAVQHLASFDYGDIPRRMHRTNTFGPATVAY